MDGPFYTFVCLLVAMAALAVFVITRLFSLRLTRLRGEREVARTLLARAVAHAEFREDVSREHASAEITGQDRSIAEATSEEEPESMTPEPDSEGRQTAVVELRFRGSDGFVGVREGTQTHDEHRRLANALIEDAKHADSS